MERHNASTLAVGDTFIGVPRMLSAIIGGMYAPVSKPERSFPDKALIERAQ
jgi:hypothetical protein